MSLPPATSYLEYQQVEKLLSIQNTRSTAPDEHLFLTVAQSMELIYHSSYHESVAMRDHLAADRVEEAIVLGERVARLIRLAADCWEVYDTITPQGFLAFRAGLGTGSGFQSPSYRLLEFVLGNRNVALAGQRGARDRRNRVPVDADPPNGVEAGLGIDHPSLGQDEVVGLGRERCGAERRKSQR